MRPAACFYYFFVLKIKSNVSYASRLGGVVPRQSHKLQAPVQFGEAQQVIFFSTAKICRGSSVGKSAALITLRSWVRLPPSTHANI